MSSKITQRLWSQAWKCASPFLDSAPCWMQKNSQSLYSTQSQRAFSWTRPRLQNGGPRRTSVTKSFTSAGVLLVEFGPSSATSAVPSCTTTVEKSLFHSSALPRISVKSLAQQAWRQDIHMMGRRRQGGNIRRHKSSGSEGQLPRKSQETKVKANSEQPKAKPEEVDHSLNSYLHLPHLPKMPHRPTKEELLAAATGFWSRLKVRFKWFSIRSARPWNVDDWSAFVSWFVLGNMVWVLLGTTTFFSLVILTINTVVAQGKHRSKYSASRH